MTERPKRGQKVDSRVPLDARRSARRSLFPIVAGLLGFAAGPAPTWAQDVPDLTGTWEGSVTTTTGQDVRLVFHIESADDGWSVTWDSPDQGAVGLPGGPITVTGSSVRIDLSVIQGGFDGDLIDRGESMAGTFRQGPAEIPLTLRRTDRSAGTLERPQEPKPPFPYDSEDVTYENSVGGGHTMAATLTLPAGPGPFPAAVLISGSGPQDRDETLQGHKPFLVLADHLTREGIAVLRFDDRGVGQSGGDFATATSEDFATDVVAAVDYLLGRPEIDDERIGLVGHSEGGLIAPIVSADDTDVAYLVLLAGPGVPGDEILLLQGALIARAGGGRESAIRESRELQREIFAVVNGSGDLGSVRERVQALLEGAASRMTARDRETSGLTESGIQTQVAQITSPWFRFFLRHDPRGPLARVSVPVLAVNGEKDLQVPPRENLGEIGRVLREAGNPDVTVRELPGLNHLFQTAVTGAPSEYGAITETFDPEAMTLVSTWILDRFGN